MENKILHKIDCGRAFKNYDKTCPRCIELINGSKPREGWGEKKAKTENKDMTVKIEMAWQIVKNADGSYHWLKTKRTK